MTPVTAMSMLVTTVTLMTMTVTLMMLKMTMMSMQKASLLLRREGLPKHPQEARPAKEKVCHVLAWCWLMYVAKHRMSNCIATAASNHQVTPTVTPMSSWTITLHILGTC